MPGDLRRRAVGVVVALLMRCCAVAVAKACCQGRDSSQGKRRCWVWTLLWRCCAGLHWRWLSWRSCDCCWCCRCCCGSGLRVVGASRWTAREEEIQAAVLGAGQGCAWGCEGSWIKGQGKRGGLAATGRWLSRLSLRQQQLAGRGRPGKGVRRHCCCCGVATIRGESGCWACQIRPGGDLAMGCAPGMEMMGCRPRGVGGSG